MVREKWQKGTKRKKRRSHCPRAVLSSWLGGRAYQTTRKRASEFKKAWGKASFGKRRSSYKAAAEGIDWGGHSTPLTKPAHDERVRNCRLEVRRRMLRRLHELQKRVEEAHAEQARRSAAKAKVAREEEEDQGEEEESSIAVESTTSRILICQAMLSLDSDLELGKPDKFSGELSENCPSSLRPASTGGSRPCSRGKPL